MKNYLFVLVFSLCLSKGIGQNLSPSLQAIVNAENAFAKTSKETNTVNAFVSHLSPTTLFMIQGDEVNAIESWIGRQPDSSLLFWYPAYADIASSEDFGYTTGPYSYYNTRKDTIPVFSGYYSSVWGKETNGEWKVLFDLGSGISKEEKRPVSTSGIKLKKNKTKPVKVNELEGLLKLDRAYAETLRSNYKSFDPTYFSVEGRIHRPRQFPITGMEKIKGFAEENQKFELTALNGRIASSCDMGYTYGKTKVTITKDGTEKILNLSYFRIWKKEDGKNWKIVLDVIGQ